MSFDTALPGLYRLPALVVLCVLAGTATPADGTPQSDSPWNGRQRAEAGVPFITNYSHREYGTHPQNWAIAQDSRGVMYFGNTFGVLEYDGAEWRLINIPNSSIVRSLAVDADGTVFVGAVGELGYLRVDRYQAASYQSLLDQLPASEQRLADVWRTFATPDGVFFWAKQKLYRWRDGRFRVWQLDSNLVPGVAGGRLYCNLRGLGLAVLDGDDFIPVAGGEAFAERRIDAILPYPGNALLLAGRDGTLSLVSLPSAKRGEARVAPFASEATTYLARHKLYAGVDLPDGGYGFATMEGGALLLDSRGRVRQSIDKSSGLQDQAVWALYPDRQGGLWLALNRGLARVEIGSPWTVFGASTGLEGTVETLVRYQGNLHAATGLGLFRLGEAGFERLPGIPSPTWSLLPFTPVAGDARLLVGAHSGAFELTAGRVRQLISSTNVFELHRLSRHPSVVLAGVVGGARILRFADGGWIENDRVEEVGDVRSFAEDDRGDLWMGTHFDGLVRLRLRFGAGVEIEEVTRFGIEEGLPALRSVKPVFFEGALRAATSEGLWRFDRETERFEQDPLLGPEAADGVLRVVPDPHGNLWLTLMSDRGPAVAWKQAGGGYSIDRRPFARLPEADWYALYPEPGNVIWLGGTEGLFRFDADSPPVEDRAFAALIRAVYKGVKIDPNLDDQDQKGALIYGGGLAAGSGPGAALRAGAPLPWEDNGLIFEFSAPTFDREADNRYRYLLEGSDRDWSSWRKESEKEYTNLTEGDYVFRVQAKNIYDVLGAEASYAFTILPPWYRTPGAYALYLMLAAAFVYGVAKLRSRRIERERDRIEGQRAALEREITARKQAEAEAERLIHELEDKNAELVRFNYTVSHDLRNPLVTIKGFLGLARRDAARADGEALERDLARIGSAADKMHGLLDDLLQLSRAGEAVHPPEAVPMAEVVDEAAELLHGIISERGVAVEVAPGLPVVHGDRARLLEVVQNLIENAVKYIGDQPAPRIEIGALNGGHADANGEGDLAGIYVRDNGIGIDPRYHDRVFGLFERLESTTPGTGVGLALVKRIVEIQGGRIWIESEGAGKGSSFCFTLPRGVAEPLQDLDS